MLLFYTVATAKQRKRSFFLKYFPSPSLLNIQKNNRLSAEFFKKYRKKVEMICTSRIYFC